jgi:rubrerythrin
MNTQQSGLVRKRQQLLRKGEPKIPPKMRISTPQELIVLLQQAIEVEHSTIPPYLCALYSIKDGSNPEAAQIIKSVVLEEMLHMVLAANVLNAIGGKPHLNHPRFIPKYPKVPLFTFKVHLEKFSRPAIETFLKIERPERPSKGRTSSEINTIAQFYEVIEQGLTDLRKEKIYTGSESRQITPEYYYGGGGQVTSVNNFDTAILALNEIVGQGEGIHHSIFDGDQENFGEVEEFAHYFRFNEIYKERRYTSVDTPTSGPSGEALIVEWDQAYPMQQDPRMASYPKDSEVWRKSHEFNRTYMGLLNELENALNGEPQRLMQSVVRMYDLKYQAVELMKIPFGDKGETAGPSFEYIK